MDQIIEEPSVPYKFEKLEVWKSSLELSDIVYLISDQLPSLENFNLKSQILRAVTSISLNIAEGSTYASSAEQKRFIRIALHSLVEVIACLKIIERRDYLKNQELQIKSEDITSRLFRMLIAYDRSIQ
jgi:four helix bundle protein